MDKDFTHSDVEIQKRERLYDGFFKVEQLQLRHRLFAGGWSGPIRRELILRDAAVGVLLYDPQLDAVALVEQFRSGALKREGSPWLLELVAGLIDSDEEPEQVARREALEEAGCTVTELVPMLNYFSSPGGSDEYFYLFCGRSDLCGAGGIHGLPEENEDIRVHVLAVDDALRLMHEGVLCNAHTIIALQWLQQRRAQLRESWR